MRARVLAVALALASLVGVACDGGDDDAPDLTATAAASSTPAPDATATPVSGVTTLTVGEPVELPEDLALIIATGCWQCDGPTTSLVRLRRTPREIEERTLFDDVPLGGGITGYAFDIAAGSAAVSTCAPNCSGLGEITGTEQTIIHLSTDGGATFTPSAPLDGWFSVEGYSGGALLISGPVGSDDSSVRVFPGMVDVPRPPDGGDPHSLPSEVLWTRIDPTTHERTALLAADGTVLFASAGDNISDVRHLDEAGDRIAVLLFRRGNRDDASYRLFIGNRAGSTLDHERTLSGGFIYAGAALDDCTLIANADLPPGSIPTPETAGAGFAGFLPAVIDICDGVIHPILEPFTRAPYLNGRNYVVGVQQGPFFSVADDVGDCLNVRDDAALDSALLGCFRAGTLLRDLDASVSRDAITWRRVLMPNGGTGWASDQFLAP